MAETLFAVALLFLLRLPFLKLPLHIDTGYFVSSATIQHRRWRFRDGWSAWAAGCSKAIPEMFYSLLYLASPRHYPMVPRLAYAGLMAIVALAFGQLVAIEGGHFFTAALIFVLLLSEPHYGTLYESCEQFELAFYTVGLLLLASGHFELAALVLALGACFVKLSGALVAGPLIVWAAAVSGFPRAFLVLAAALAALALYAAWIGLNRKDPRQLLRVLRAQQRALAAGQSLRQRLEHKGLLLWQIWSYWPVLPALALAGVVLHPSGMMFVYLGGVLAAYLAQGNRVWYYAIPFIPFVAYHAALAASEVAWGWAAVLVAWLALFLARLLPLDMVQRHLWVWRLHNERGQAVKNAGLGFGCLLVQGRGRPFVFGHETQVYAMVGRAYPTPEISAAWFVDRMAPGWRQRLARRFQDDPPEMLIDTTGTLSVKGLQRATGLEYKHITTWPAGAEVYEFNGWRPRVSALVSAYFCEQYLEGRLENLLEQTLRPEIVVVCQAGSAEQRIAERMLDWHDRLIETEDVPTIYAAWNMAIGASSAGWGRARAPGEYLTNANADDRLIPTAYAELAGILDARPEVALVYPNVDIVESLEGGVEHARRVGRFEFLEGGYNELLQLCFIGPIPMWRRALHDRRGMFDPQMQSAGDYEFWLRIAKAGEKFYHFRKSLGIYLRRPDSAEHRDPSIGERETALARRRYRQSA